jgi:hypothetical protein
MNRFVKLAGLLGTTMFAHNAIADTLSISRLDAHDIKSSYFELSEDQKVEIEFLAPKSVIESDYDEDRRGERNLTDFVWIIDLNTRETVWRSRKAEEIESGKNRGLKVYGDKVNLDKGRYGMFYSTHNFRAESHSGMDFFLYGLSTLLRDDNKITHEDMESFYVDLRAKDIEKIKPEKSFNPFAGTKEVVSLHKVRKNRFEQFGLSVAKDTELSIYALGEIAGSDAADSAWLKNADSGEIVWKMDKESTQAAGGARKNRKFKGTIPVSKGSYVLSYSSDGSHHYNDWNSQPPYDPQAWGVSVYADKAAKVEMFNPKERLEALKVLSISKVGNNAYLSKHFKLSKATDVRVVALGERTGSRSMADHGWIVNSKDHSKVWKMKARDTQHAGGSSKNRISDEIINLPAGEYTVNYESDGSHSYDGGWNAARPHDEKTWGISLYGVGDGFDKKSIEMLKSADSNAIAQIVRVGDGQRRSEEFELTAEQKVRIYAIGEGDSGDMSDYGFIKNSDTGKRVWYMFSDETEHAGGAGKNRQVNEVITLPKGKYKLYFRTDGSHSFGDWNANPPTDKQHYGITVYDASK